MTLHHSSQADTEQEYELVTALTDRYCRFVVRSFREVSEDDASVEDLSTAFARENSGAEDEAALHPHHRALPKLSDIGVVDYDAWSNTAHYHGHSELEDVLDGLGSDSQITGTGW